ncbi:MAG: FHA domain-containing protein [bacterium]
MMAMLMVTREKRQGGKAVINKRIFIVGRSRQCDLTLDDEPMASRQHIEIEAGGDGHWLKDKGSRNGTFLNGKPVVDRVKLNDGDEIEIGLTRLKFLVDQEASSGAEPAQGETRVMNVPRDEKKAGSRKSVIAASKGDWQVKLTIVEGPFAGGVFANWEGPLLLGRGLDNHVVLLDDAVSIHQARIITEGDRYLLEDLDSSNGTFVEGIKVRKQALESGQRIKIGVSTLVFKQINIRLQRRFRNRILLAAGILVLVLGLVKLLQPPDLAGRSIDQALKYYAQGEFEKALEGYQSALKYDAQSATARDGIRQVKAELAARDALAAAEVAAGRENYERAKELCYQVLRDLPGNARARNMEAVIKSIENARIAVSARNWGDAVRLLEKARETYPKSALVRQRLEAATRELEAEQNLVKANECLQHKQGDMAESCLKAIPESSVYFIEARGVLDAISLDHKSSEYWRKAQACYQQGLLTEALVEIDAGLRVVSSSAALLGLREKIRQIEPLLEPLAVAEAMASPDDVDLLWRGVRTCETIIQKELDPLNAVLKRAVKAQARLQKRLHEVSQDNAVKAEAATAAGHTKEAFVFLKQAVQADSGNTAAARDMEAVRRKITAASRSLYQKGIVHEELGQLDLARQAFTEAMTISVPDEVYYERAARKLKDYAQ